MSATVSTEFLLMVAQATAEQQAAIERFLRGETGALASSPQLRRDEAGFVFRKAGSHWRVVFKGAEFHIKDTFGARYLDCLLHHPNQTIPAFDLEVAVSPEKADARSRDSIQKERDPEATRAYLRELSRLRLEREEVVEAGMLGEADRLEGEIEAVEVALRGGCRITDAGERARSNVNKAVAAVRRRLERGEHGEKEFGEHIRRFVSVGYECMYAQPPLVCWA